MACDAKLDVEGMLRKLRFFVRGEKPRGPTWEVGRSARVLAAKRCRSTWASSGHQRTSWPMCGKVQSGKKWEDQSVSHVNVLRLLVA